MWLLEELLFVTLLSTVSAGPLPSVELLLVSKGPFTEEQTTEWAQSPAVDGGPVVNASKPVSEILLDLDQSTGLRQTRQVSPLQAMEQPYLYFVMRQFLVKIYPNGTGVQALRLTSNPVGNSTVLQQPNAIACDFDARDNVLIWSDVQLGAIYVAQEDGTNLRKVVDLDGGVADGLAWDWISKKLYWTDFKHKTIEVLDPSSGLRKLLFRTGNSSNPRAIVLDPTTRCMYLTDWGVNPAIQRASMDGTSLVNLHTTNLVWPNGLTIDYETQTLYWADAYLDKIECSSTDGSGRRTLITQNVLHPFGLTFCNGFLYWTDWMIRAVVAAPVTHDRTPAPLNFEGVILNLILDPMGIHMVSEERQPLAPNPCKENNGGCSHLCLLSNTSSDLSMCICPDGMYISTDRKNCYQGTFRPVSPATTQPCIPECQNNGLCTSPGICSCAAGWTGARCDEPICTPGCQNQGTCIKTGVCLCTEDWEGQTCEKAVCDNSFCLNGGECIRHNVCKCPTGWTGTRCERPVCSSGCSNGMCTGPNTCTCEHGWTGEHCDQAVCKPKCENGNCTAPDFCHCDPGWEGVLCTEPICSQQCSFVGRCVAPDTCECPPQFTGSLCEKAICFEPSGCLNGGVCLWPSLCACQDGWSGRDCGEATCSPSCIHGDCISPDTCACHIGWEGRACEKAICLPQGCDNDGYCIFPQLCICTSEWTGKHCEEPVCTGGCDRDRGTCVRNYNERINECRCNDNYEGPQCQQAVCNPPCENGGTCDSPGHCACPIGIIGTRCEFRKD